MIEFKTVSKKYGFSVAVDSISFRIDDGTACGYIGPNGAGKTTTARIIVGLEKPDRGEIKVAWKSGPPISALGTHDPHHVIRNHKSGIGYVPESAKLYESMTPAETITMASLLRKFDKKEAIKRLEVLSQILSFREYLKKPIQGLSKGTKQKIVISLALMFNPKVLVLDEPTDGLDVQAVVALKRLIKSFTSHGGTVFYSSHLLDIVESVCDKVYFIDKGQIVGEYSSNDFIGKRGYLEDVFMEHVDSQNHLVDAFFENNI
ncbi:MAG TPA: ABC transporter ATP-binding protein [Candidatus Acidoferrales bacterium]|nr:ABC transporter ATP-binding protein [Candidatus Acidoferrales bacterium]